MVDDAPCDLQYRIVHVQASMQRAARARQATNPIPASERIRNTRGVEMAWMETRSGYRCTGAHISP